MFEEGLYYIALHETTYCTPTPFFSDTVKYIAHGRIIRTIRYICGVRLAASLHVCHTYIHTCTYFTALMMFPFLFADSVHNDGERHIPYISIFPNSTIEKMISWAKFQLPNGMIQEQLRCGCFWLPLEPQVHHVV